MTTYLGVDLLDVVPDRPERAINQVARFGTLVGPSEGLVTPLWQSADERWTRPFIYTCQSRTALVALQTFVHARLGRYAPCWVPTWDDDLTLAANIVAFATTCTIVRASTLALSLLGTGTYRHAVLLPYSGPYPGSAFPFRIGGVTDNGDGTATLRPAFAGAAFPTSAAKATTRVSLLKYVRLEGDAVSYDYSVPGIVTATLQFTELPFEVP